jgi:hypothetical protein
MSVVSTGLPDPGRHRPVELDVVAEVRLGVVERGEHARHLLGHDRQLLGRRAHRRQAAAADLQHQPRLEHLVAGEAVQRGQEAQRAVLESRRPVGHERAGALARDHHAHGAELLQAGAQRRPADADLDRQVPLRRQAVALAQLAALDQAAHVLDHPAGGLIRAQRGRGRTFGLWCHGRADYGPTGRRVKAIGLTGEDGSPDPLVPPA